MSDDECGEEQGNGERCDYPAKYADGKCGIHTDQTDSRQGGAKFTDDRAQLAIEAAREGKSKRGCERTAGVGKGTLDRWLEQDRMFENANGQIARFVTAFAQARAQGESEFIRRGMDDPDVDASFARFMLASSFDYKKTERVESEVEQTTTHELDDDDRDLARETILRLQEERLEGTDE